VRFRALDCEGNPVRALTAGDVSVVNDEKGVPFGKGGEGDSASGVGENSNVELYSVLVLDFSNSIYEAGSVDAVVDGAEAFVDETVTKPQVGLKHRVAIIAFGRPDQITLEHDFSQDAPSLVATLEALRTAPPRGTTDLYDAYMLALDTVAAQGSGGDAVVERFVVLLTDGTHEAGNEQALRTQALARKHATDATVYTIGIEGTYDACRLEELAGRGGVTSDTGCRELAACTTSAAPPAACTQFLPSVSRKAIGDAFQQIAARAAGIARSNYVVGICTPVSLGTPTLTLKVDVDGTKAEKTMGYDVAGLNGDVNACDAPSIQQGKLACDGAGQCVIVCLHLACGVDQGVSCGTCGAKQLCSAKQTCDDVCVGMTCGVDQGVSCGTCAAGDYCQASVCATPCVGKQCGTDHGVSCGACGPKQLCDAAQTCVDLCVGMTCGVDQGVSCGTCAGSDYCQANVCTTPCAGKQCGADHGVSCGACGAKKVCDAAQKCADVCVGMTCGADQGVSCGTCAGSDYCQANVCTTPCAGKQCGTDHGVACGACTFGSLCSPASQCVPCSGTVGCGCSASVACQPGVLCVSGVCHAPSCGDGIVSAGEACDDGNVVTGDGCGSTCRRVVALAVGDLHGCVLLDDGSVKCWGYNGAGQLGLGDSQSRGDAPGELGDSLLPVDLGAGRTAKAISAGDNHTCALLDDATVKCWGWNPFGQLGLGDKQVRGMGPNQMGNNLPVVDLGTGRTAKAISGHDRHTCAILDDGTVKCWGYNLNGRLGLGDTVDRGGAAGEMGDYLPPLSLGTGRTAKALSIGPSAEFDCAILDNGALKCWGKNGAGQLGLGDPQDRGDGAGEMGDNLPVVNLGTGRTAKIVVVGGGHTCAILDNGAVKCWGGMGTGLGDTLNHGDGAGEMGDSLPVVSLGTGRTAKAITAGVLHTCAILDNGAVKCWGYGADGETGLGDPQTRGDGPNEMGDNLPAVALGAGRTAKALAAGGVQTCALLDNDTIKCWGGNNYGQLGLGDVNARGAAPNQMGDSLPALLLP
jgi:alpha-tubulin suppressor-like RCC1 family protein